MNQTEKSVALYDFRENPPQEGEEHPGYHVVLANHHSYALKDIAEATCAGTSLTESDLYHAVMDICDFLKSRLATSNTIRVDGLGSFSLKIKGPRAAQPDEHVGRKIEISGIRFIPDARLLNSIRMGTTFHRTKRPHTFLSVPDETAQRDLLRQYFTKNHFILLRDLTMMMNCGRTKAGRICARLVEEGVLERRGTPRRPIYIAGPALLHGADSV